MNAGSNLEKILRAGHFAVTGELGPPQSADATVIARKAAILKGYVDAVNLTDNQTKLSGSQTDNANYMKATARSQYATPRNYRLTALITF